MSKTTSTDTAFIGDIHCQDRYLQICLTFLHENGIQDIFCTGDIVDGRGDVHRCIQLLRQSKVDVVLGNHDDWMLKGVARDVPEATRQSDLARDEVEYLSALPRTIDIKTPNGIALLCHGVAENYMGKINPDDYGYALESNDQLQRLIRERKYEYMLNGHSNKRMVRDIQGLTIINAGALVGWQGAGFVTVDFMGRSVVFWNMSEAGNVETAETMRI
jgi:predicted phosphodiesterase